MWSEVRKRWGRVPFIQAGSILGPGSPSLRLRLLNKWESRAHTVCTLAAVERVNA